MRERHKLYEDTTMKLYNQGLNDVEIAKRLGVDNTTVSRWRKNHGLPSNYREGVQKSEKMSGLTRDSVLARQAGMTYGAWKAEQGK
jgi:uncharacterized protein YjcR